MTMPASLIPISCPILVTIYPLTVPVYVFPFLPVNVMTASCFLSSFTHSLKELALVMIQFLDFWALNCSEYSKEIRAVFL